MEKSITRKLKVWSLLGPSSILLSLLVLFYKAHSPHEIFWELGLIFTIALGFVIICLTYQEVIDLFVRICSEARATVIEVEEKSFSSQSKLEKDLELSRIAFSRQLEQFNVLEQLLSVAREDLISTRHENEKMKGDREQERQAEAVRCEELHLQLQYYQNQLRTNERGNPSQSELEEDFHQLQQEMHQVQEKYQYSIEMQQETALLLTKKELKLNDQENRLLTLDEDMRELRHLLQSATQENETLLKRSEEAVSCQQASLAQLSEKEMQLKAMSTDELTLKENIKELQQQLQSANQINETLLKRSEEVVSCQQASLAQLSEKEIQLKQLEIDRFNLEGKLVECQKNAETTLTEKSPEDQLLRQTQGLYKQLREQFYEKSTVLDEARRELFRVYDQLEAKQREDLERNQFEYDELQSKLEQYVMHVDREHQLEKSQLEKEKGHLEALITHLLTQFPLFR
jgi:hypothetical protein